jgi:hypothetical protein
MACRDFKIFNDKTEEELVSISSFLFKHGAGLPMTSTGMDKDTWLQYHKKNAHKDCLALFKKPFLLPEEDLAKHLSIPEEPQGLDWKGKAVWEKTVGTFREVARFRLGGS